MQCLAQGSKSVKFLAIYQNREGVDKKAVRLSHLESSNRSLPEIRFAKGHALEAVPVKADFDVGDLIDRIRSKVFDDQPPLIIPQLDQCICRATRHTRVEFNRHLLWYANVTSWIFCFAIDDYWGFDGTVDHYLHLLKGLVL